MTQLPSSSKHRFKDERLSIEATVGANDDSEDSEDDKPLSARLMAGLSKVS